MQVRIKGIRPPLLSKDSYESLNELRGFRHIFRYAYSYGLDDQRVFDLLRQISSKKDNSAILRAPCSQLIALCHSNLASLRLCEG